MESIILGQLPRQLTPHERGALWQVALALEQIVNTSGFGQVTLYIRDGLVSGIDTTHKDKRIPEL